VFFKKETPCKEETLGVLGGIPISELKSGLKKKIFLSLLRIQCVYFLSPTSQATKKKSACQLFDIRLQLNLILRLGEAVLYCCTLITIMGSNNADNWLLVRGKVASI